MEVGEEAELEARVNGLAPAALPPGAPPLEWSSSDDEVAQVSASGLVSARNEGVADIRLVVAGLSASIQVRVAPVGTTIGPEGGSLALAGGAVRLVVPQGALEARVALQVEELEDAPDVLGLPEGVQGTGWQIGPQELTLSEPGELRLAFAGGTLPAGLHPEMLRAHRQSWGGDDDWILIPAGNDFLDPDDDGDGILTTFERGGRWMLAGIRPTPSSGIAAGADHACALATDDTLWCWGSNDESQIRDDPGNNVTTPLPGPQGLRPKALASGEGSSCALSRDSELWCWGRIAREFGDGGGRVASHGWDREIGSHHAGLAVGSQHACALDSEGTVWCWGRNERGQLGTGSTSGGSSEPGPVLQGDRVFTAIAAAGHGTMAVDTDGGVFAWGSFPSHGDEGDLMAESATPLQVIGEVTEGHPVEQVAMSASAACALDDEGRLWCWGDNSSGQRGIGAESDENVLRPVQRVDGSAPFNGVSMAAGDGGHVCAVDGEGSVWCWGRNEAGQLGEDSDERCRAGGEARECARSPVLVAGLSGVSGVTLGTGFSCAVTHSGDLYCWGSNGRGQFGTGDTSDGGAQIRSAATGR